MKCVGLILVLVALHGVNAELDDKLLQTFEDILSNVTVSESCQEALEIYLAKLQNKTLWALQMFDATSKIPVGLLSLNLGELGQFDECLSIESEDGLIQPKYCLGAMPTEVLLGLSVNKAEVLRHEQFHRLRQTSRSLINLKSAGNEEEAADDSGIHWAICIPTQCSDEDVGELFGLILQNKHANCQTKEDLSPPLTPGAIAAIVILSIFAFLLVSSTAVDLYYRYVHKEPSHVVLIAFSMYSNGQKLFRINHNSNELTCLNGIRLLSMMWVIVGHIFSSATGLPLMNYMDVATWTDTLRSMTLVSAPLSVDSFFFLSGVLVVYSYMKAKYNGVKFNIFHFYIHRFLRLTPALAAAILVTGHLMKYLGSGPVWSFIVDNLEHPCQKYWWTTLLYIYNYAGIHQTCVPQSWYLSPDMQLYIISPLLLYPLWKYPKVGLGLTITCILTFIVVPFTIAYIHELNGVLSNIYITPEKTNEYMLVYYIQTHTRAAPWFIGLLTGYLLAKIKFEGGQRHLKVNRIVIILGWIICIACTLTCIYGGHSTLRGAEYNKWGNILHIALVRPTWTICLSWVTFACVTGNGGPINWLLSLPVYQVLNRFTYSMYLIHVQVIYIFAFRTRIGIYFDEMSLAYSFWGTTMITFFLSIPWVLAFESPIVILEKLIFGGSKRKNTLEGSDKKNPVPA